MKTDQIAQTAQTELGNTKPIPPKKETKRSRRFCFTINNYSEDEIAQLHKSFDGSKYIIGKEVGDEGTPHLQGYVEFKFGKTLTALKKINNRAHWEIAKGNTDQNVKYCSKEGNFTTNLEVPIDMAEEILKDEYQDVVWKPWQQNVLDIIESKANRRTINWFWEAKGNVGKSFLCLYLDCKYDVIICDGKKGDVFNQINVWRTTYPNRKAPSVIICDIPRSYKDCQISYGCLEKIKDGLIYSGKYEGGKIRMGPVHIICFANHEPDLEELSEDRWNVVEIV